MQEVGNLETAAAVLAAPGEQRVIHIEGSVMGEFLRVLNRIIFHLRSLLVKEFESDAVSPNSDE